MFLRSQIIDDGDLICTCILLIPKSMSFPLYPMFANIYILIDETLVPQNRGNMRGHAFLDIKLNKQTTPAHICWRKLELRGMR